jgi:hypothetical protein
MIKNEMPLKARIIFSIALLVYIIVIIYMCMMVKESKIVTERMINCAENNKTYIHITSIEEESVNMDYCGDMEQIILLFKELKPDGEENDT